MFIFYYAGTVTIQVSVNPPSVVVKVIVAVPVATAVTNPPTDTVATRALLVDQVPVCTDPTGSTAFVSCLVAKAASGVAGKHPEITTDVALTSVSAQNPANAVLTSERGSTTIDPSTM